MAGDDLGISGFFNVSCSLLMKHDALACDKKQQYTFFYIIIKSKKKKEANNYNITNRRSGVHRTTTQTHPLSTSASPLLFSFSLSSSLPLLPPTLPHSFDFIGSDHDPPVVDSSPSLELHTTFHSFHR